MKPYARTLADIDIRIATQRRRRDQAAVVEDMENALAAMKAIDRLLDERFVLLLKRRSW
jgi:hypothetical protein